MWMRVSATHFGTAFLTVDRDLQAAAKGQRTLVL
jgi:hypothetical protein